MTSRAPAGPGPPRRPARAATTSRSGCTTAAGRSLPRTRTSSGTLAALLEQRRPSTPGPRRPSRRLDALAASRLPGRATDDARRARRRRRSPGLPARRPDPAPRLARAGPASRVGRGRTPTPTSVLVGGRGRGGPRAGSTRSSATAPAISSYAWSTAAPSSARSCVPGRDRVPALHRRPAQHRATPTTCRSPTATCARRRRPRRRRHPGRRRPRAGRPGGRLGGARRRRPRRRAAARRPWSRTVSAGPRAVAPGRARTGPGTRSVDVAGPLTTRARCGLTTLRGRQ